MACPQEGPNNRVSTVLPSVLQSCKGILSLPLTQVVSNDGLVQALAFVQKLGDILWGALQQVILNEELNALRNK